jgi:hypothetical protein
LGSFSAIGIEKEEGMVVVEEESDTMTWMCRGLALIPCEIECVKRSTTLRWPLVPC